jgi:endonuclease YncB( thermonuclease family)
MLIMAIGVGGGVVFGLRETGLASWLLDTPAPVLASIPARSFAACAGSARVTCVVDGDTFWLNGEKIRIADINTPEVGSPSCPEEAALGRQASRRLVELLSAGPFSLAAADRDEDQYGRKLRIVERDGRSVGKILVAEGLAHEWRGRRESWC